MSFLLYSMALYTRTQQFVSAVDRVFPSQQRESISASERAVMLNQYLLKRRSCAGRTPAKGEMNTESFKGQAARRVTNNSARGQRPHQSTNGVQ